jgi:hypothetical protein
MADNVEAAPNWAKLVLPVFNGDTNAPASLSFIQKVNAYQQVMQVQGTVPNSNQRAGNCCHHDLQGIVLQIQRASTPGDR